MDENLCNEVCRWQEKLFQRSVRRQMRLRKLKELLGPISGQRCLEISAGDGVISQQLRIEGGSWTTLVPSPEAQVALGYFVGDEVQLINDGVIDAPDGAFDAVVIVDVLERVPDDSAFIKECHRVLKSDGRLIVSAARRLKFPVSAGLLRIALGLSWKKCGLKRPGYTPTEFFNVLKDGFDVPETDTYSTCSVEVPGLICEAIANLLAHGPYTLPPADAGTEEFYHYRKIRVLSALAYPLMCIASQFDNLLLSILPGHNIAAKTKRRIWRARRTPQLIDGRSIAEAALNTKIGTAAPF